jgi:segregation and condensation protein B
MEPEKIASAVEAILFAAGDPVPADRIAKVLGVDTEEVFLAAKTLADAYSYEGRGIRLLRLEDKLQLCSAPEFSQEITRVLEQRKPPRLSQAALEVLAVVAYYQPVTRAYIDQVRGVDSSYTLGVLVERGLVEAGGKLEVPGRPTVFKTGDAFLRTMGISELSQLPALPDLTNDEGIVALQNKIDALQSAELEGQMSISEE